MKLRPKKLPVIKFFLWTWVRQFWQSNWNFLYIMQNMFAQFSEKFQRNSLINKRSSSVNWEKLNSVLIKLAMFFRQNLKFFVLTKSRMKVEILILLKKISSFDFFLWMRRLPFQQTSRNKKITKKTQSTFASMHDNFSRTMNRHIVSKNSCTSNFFGRVEVTFATLLKKCLTKRNYFHSESKKQ